MMAVRPTVLTLVAGIFVLMAAACSGGKSEDQPSSESETTPVDSPSSPGVDSKSTGGTAAESPTSAATTGTDAKPSATTLPATRGELRSMSNVLLGEGQELVVWLRALFGDVECGGGCAGNTAQRWKTVGDICAARKWTLIKVERGYDPRLHDELLAALTDACARVTERLNAQSPVDDEEWRQFASDTLDMVTPYLDNLLEAGTKEGFLN